MTDDEDPRTVLALAPGVSEESVEACVRVLDCAGDLDRAVAVTVGTAVAEWLAAWERHGATVPVTCVDVDTETRSAKAGSTVVPDGDRPDVTVEHVRDPRNLERVGRTVSDVLQQSDEAGERVGLVVHSLSDLLGHVDESTAFKFVYTLGEVVRRVDGVACFHLDPDVHDDETVETFSIACDTVVEVDRDAVVTDGAR